MDSSQAPLTGQEAKTENPSRKDNTEPVTGIKFTLMLISLTLAALLIFLDTSVVSTVSPIISKVDFDSRLTRLSFNRPCQKSQTSSSPCLTLAGMGARTNSEGMFVPVHFNRVYILKWTP